MKYIIDAPSNLYKIDGTLRVPVKVGEGDLCWYNTYLKVESYTEPDRKSIEDEVWEFVRTVTDMTEAQRIQCFGGATCDLDEYLTYQEAKAKFEAWLKQKDEIHVGDEVIIPGDINYDKMIITRLWKDMYDSDAVDTIGYDGRICSFLKSKVKKTGRHFDEVESLLKRMRGDSDD